MTKLSISISSITQTIDVSDEEIDSFKSISFSLNEKTNNLLLEIGKVSDRLLLFIILLININKKENIFNKNFDKKIIELLKKVSPFLKSETNLDSQLIFASLISENEILHLKDSDLVENNNEDEMIKKIKFEEEENIKFISEIIDFINQLKLKVEKI